MRQNPFEEIEALKAEVTRLNHHIAEYIQMLSEIEAVAAKARFNLAARRVRDVVD